jgi:hypothetical protein
MTVISMNMTSVRAVAARLEREADALTGGCRDLAGTADGAQTSAELGRIGAEWIGFLTRTRAAVSATAGALLRVSQLFEDAETHAELPRRGEHRP